MTLTNASGSRSAHTESDLTHQIPGGHRYRRDGNEWFLTDDEQAEYFKVDQSRPIQISCRNIFGQADDRMPERGHIPLVGEEQSTIASIHEAFWVATNLDMAIRVQGRLYEVRRKGDRQTDVARLLNEVSSALNEARSSGALTTGEIIGLTETVLAGFPE